MNKNLCILIDIGGTAIKFGVSDFDGNFIEKDQRPTEAKEFGGPGIVSKVIEICKNYITKYDNNILGVAVSTAGMVNPETCEIIYALEDAIPQYTGVNYKKIIKENFNLPCFVENDVNCAALGEKWLGAGNGASSVFCMTIGTSIGGAMIVNDKLVSGASNSAGEVAYMIVPGGILHNLASTTYLVNLYAKKANLDVKNVNGVLIFNNAEKGEQLAIDAIDDLIEHLTDGITNVVSCQNPEVIILGGGIMARSTYLKPRIEAKLKQKLRPLIFEKTKITFASRQNDAGMLGALYNFNQRK